MAIIPPFLGFEKDITDNLKTGIFAGIGRTALDYDGFDDNYDNQDDYYGGLFGFYLKGNWYGAALVSFYRAVHHYNGETGPNLTIDENDRYSSWAIDSRILGAARQRAIHSGGRVGKNSVLSSVILLHRLLRQR